MVGELREDGFSLRAALDLVGVARSTWHYHLTGRESVADPIPQNQRRDPRALTAGELARIEELIEEQWAGGNSVMEAFAKAWNEGEYVASPRSWYRVAARLNQQLRPACPARKKRCKREAPVVKASGPDHVWVWDITDLPGPFKNTRFKAYCTQDLYSRKIVAYTVQHREKDALAINMFETAFGTQGIPGLLHSDNGAVMRSSALETLCSDTNIDMSFNRPSVSNDNPFKESEFRTMKHRPNYPGYFETIEEARTWLEGYVHWFNNHHHHSALAWHTPQSVYDGTWTHTHKTRAKTLQDHYETHPNRYNKKPEMSRPPTTVGINLENTKTQK